MGRYSRRLAPEFARAAGVAGGAARARRRLRHWRPDGRARRHRRRRAVAGVDPSEPFVEECRASVPGADVRVAPAEALPFDDDTFDRALAQLVFHFVGDPPRPSAR